MNSTLRAPQTVRVQRRPGWVTYSAVILLSAGVFYVLLALSEFSNSYWLYNTPHYIYNVAGAHLFWWGIFDSVLAVVTITAGVSVLGGGFYGYVMGFAVAGFGIVRWLFNIPADPWLSMTIIALDGLVIYGLAKSVEYFPDAVEPFNDRA